MAEAARAEAPCSGTPRRTWPGGPSSRGSPVRNLVLVLAGAVGYVWLLAISAGGLPDHDQFVMARVVREVLAGKSLYSEAWDNKAPLALYFYAAPQLVAPRSYVAIQVFLGVWLLAQAAILFVGLGGDGGPARYVAPAILLLLPLQHADWLWASSEHAGNLFVVVMLVVAYRVGLRGILKPWECAMAGVALALAFNTRQSLAVFGAVPLLAILLAFRSVQRRAGVLLLAFTAGIAAGLVSMLVVVLVSSGGSLAGYLRTVILAPASYGIGWSHARWLLLGFRTDVTIFLALSSALVAATGSARTFAVVLASATAAALFLPMRGYPHYWVQAFPETALLATLAVDALGVQASRKAAWQGALVASLLLASGVYSVLELGNRPAKAVLT